MITTQMYFAFDLKIRIPGIPILKSIESYDLIRISTKFDRRCNSDETLCIWEVNIDSYLKSDTYSEYLSDPNRTDRTGIFNPDSYIPLRSFEVDLSFYEYLFPLNQTLFENNINLCQWAIRESSFEAFEFAFSKLIFAQDFPSSRGLNHVHIVSIVGSIVDFNNLPMLKIFHSKMDLVNFSYLIGRAIIVGCKNKSFEVLSYFLEVGVDVNYDECMAMRIAIEKSNMEMIKFLIERGSEYNGRDFAYIAAAYGNAEVLSYILSLGLSDTNLSHEMEGAIRADKLENLETLYYRSKGVNSIDLVRSCVKHHFDQGLKFLISMGEEMDHELIFIVKIPDIYQTLMENGAPFNDSLPIVSNALRDSKTRFFDYLMDYHREDVIQSAIILRIICKYSRIDFLKSIHIAGADLNLGLRLNIKASCREPAVPSEDLDATLTYLLENTNCEINLGPLHKCYLDYSEGYLDEKMIITEVFIKRGLDINYSKGYALMVLAKENDLDSLRLLLGYGANDMRSINALSEKAISKLDSCTIDLLNQHGASIKVDK